MTVTEHVHQFRSITRPVDPGDPLSLHFIVGSRCECGATPYDVLRDKLFDPIENARLAHRMATGGLLSSSPWIGACLPLWSHIPREQMRRRAIRRAIWFGLMPWRLYERQSHYAGMNYWQHLAMNVGVVWRWARHRETQDDRRFEWEVNWHGR